MEVIVIVAVCYSQRAMLAQFAYMTEDEFNKDSVNLEQAYEEIHLYKGCLQLNTMSLLRVVK